jgi:peroxiredoxin
MSVREAKLPRRTWLVWLLLPALALAAAPAVTLRDLDGRSREAKEFIGRGQWTVVAVWSVDCVICQREIPEVEFFHDEHRGRDARVLGVSVDGYADRARIRKFVDDNSLSFPNLIAERAEIAQFGAGPLRGTPTYIVFSPTGALVARRVGATGIAELERIVAGSGQRPR